jgi:2,2-dialkylglycine decarboxylase (pyruvate)
MSTGTMSTGTMSTETMSTETMSTETLWHAADKHLLHYTGSGGFSPELIVEARGSFVMSASGRRILDFTSGQMSAVLGHSHPDVVETVRRSSDTLAHLFSGMVSPPLITLAQRLSETLPDPLEQVLLLTTGAESNEAAIRLAKLVTGKHEIVSLSRSWHGMSLAVANATYSAGRRGYGPAAPGNFALPTPDVYRPDFTTSDGQLDWRRQLDFGFGLIDAQSVGSLAACIVEPILSSGGVIDLPVGYLAALQQKCRERDMLLIVDEAQTGLCRTGAWYAFERDGIVPDILTLSKTLGAGLPVAAVVTTAEIGQAARDRGFLFFTTHVSDPLAASIGLTVLDVLQRDRLEVAAAEHGDFLTCGLEELALRHPSIGDVRGRGMMVGVELICDRTTKQAAGELGSAVTARCFELGLHMNIVQLPGLSSIMRIAPPLTASTDELSLGLEIFDQALTELEPKFLAG